MMINSDPFPILSLALLFSFCTNVTATANNDLTGKSENAPSTGNDYPLSGGYSTSYNFTFYFSNFHNPYEPPSIIASAALQCGLSASSAFAFAMINPIGNKVYSAVQMVENGVYKCGNSGTPGGGGHSNSRGRSLTFRMTNATTATPASGASTPSNNDTITPTTTNATTVTPSRQADNAADNDNIDSAGGNNRLRIRHASHSNDNNNKQLNTEKSAVTSTSTSTNTTTRNVTATLTTDESQPWPLDYFDIIVLSNALFEAVTDGFGYGTENGNDGDSGSNNGSSTSTGGGGGGGGGICIDDTVPGFDFGVEWMGRPGVFVVNGTWG